MKRTSKLFQYINYRMRVTLQDGRTLVGTFMAYDTHMNLVIGDCEEFRKVKSSKDGQQEEREEKRTLGLLVLRGDSIVSLTVEGPPPKEESRIKAMQKEGISGPGVAKAAARGMAVPTAAAGAGAGLVPPQPGSLAFPMAPGLPGAPPSMIPPPGMPPGMMPPGRGMPFPPPPPGMLPPGMPGGRGMPFPPPGMAPPPGMPPMPPGMPPFGRGMPFPPPPGMPGGRGMPFPPPPGMLPPGGLPPPPAQSQQQ